jgi:hypothetical protein
MNTAQLEMSLESATNLHACLLLSKTLLLLDKLRLNIFALALSMIRLSSKWRVSTSLSFFLINEAFAKRRRLSGGGK